MTHATLLDDLPVNRQLRFTIDGHALHLVRAKGESIDAFYLRLLAYGLYAEKPELAQHTEWHGKFAPDWAVVDHGGTVHFYLRTRPVSHDELLHILRHHNQAEVVVVKVFPGVWDKEDLNEAVQKEIQQIRRHIHYRYTSGRLTITYLRPLADWFDPHDLNIPDDVTHTVRF